jgi:hypothetical protein
MRALNRWVGRQNMNCPLELDLVEYSDDRPIANGY